MASQTDAPWTVLRLLDWTKGYFSRSDLESPRLCAEVLLAHVLGCQRIELYARYDYQPSEQQLSTFRELVKRAADHVPVAYLVGHREFYSLRFKVTPAVLVPRPETEQLVEEVISHCKGLGRPARMWDICTGSGCIAIAAASQVKNLTVLASDISSDALAIAGQNAQNLGVADRVTLFEADLANLPETLRENAPFDIITANPPYVGLDDPVGPETCHEPRLALYAGSDGLDCIRPLVEQVGQWLNEGGIFAMEFGQGQADAVRDLLVATGQFAEPRIQIDLQGIERSCLAVKCGR